MGGRPHCYIGMISARGAAGHRQRAQQVVLLWRRISVRRDARTTTRITPSSPLEISLGSWFYIYRSYHNIILHTNARLVPVLSGAQLARSYQYTYYTVRSKEAVVLLLTCAATIFILTRRANVCVLTIQRDHLRGVLERWVSDHRRVGIYNRGPCIVA